MVRKEKKAIFMSCLITTLTGVMIATPTGYDWGTDYEKYLYDYEETEEIIEIEEIEQEEQEEVIEPKRAGKRASLHEIQYKPIEPIEEIKEKEIPREEILEKEIVEEEQQETTATCSICFEEKPLSEMLECSKKPKCKCKTCRLCTNRLYSPELLTEERDEEGTTHPRATRYQGPSTPTEEFKKIKRYQNATPESEPNWKWFRIKNKNYFLEEGTLWRYEKNEAPDDGYLHANCWRYIRPPRCPICKDPHINALKPFAINQQHEHTH